MLFVPITVFGGAAPGVSGQAVRGQRLKGKRIQEDPTAWVSDQTRARYWAAKPSQQSGVLRWCSAQADNGEATPQNS